MQNEKIAIIALVLIIAGALTVFFIATYGGDLFKESPEDKSGIQYGDCVDINYIGRYASNNTIFDSSYVDPETKTDGSLLRIYVSEDQMASPPTGYSNYSAGIIEGLMSRLIGLEEGESATLGPIPPDEAYGERIDVGDTINSIVFNQNIIFINESINQTLEVTSKNETSLTLQWVDSSDEKFTMPTIIIYGSLDMDASSPDYEDIIKMAPPFALWKDATEIIETTDEYYLTKTTPTKTDNLSDKIEQIPLDLLSGESLFIFPDATSVSYDDTTITFTHNPVEGRIYSYSEQSIYGPISYELTVENVTIDTIDISIFIVEYNQTQTYSLNRTANYNRTFEYPRVYDMDISFLEQALPQFMLDLEREGYSFSDLAGESLIFEVTVENLYKTSEDD